jgi:serine protease Do
LSDTNPTKKPLAPRRSLRAQALAGTALGLLLAGAFAAGDAAISNHPAYAAAIPETQVQPAQAPDFADLVEKVSPAVVSIRVRETVQPTANSGEDFSDPSQGSGDLPPEMKRFFNQLPNMPGQDQQDFTDRSQRFGDLSPEMRKFFQQLPNAPRQSQQPSMALGSGFFVSADGYVVTNNHVVDNSNDFTVVTADGTEYHAKLIGKDDRTDLALLKVSSDKAFPSVKFSHDAIRVGQWIVAVGNPFGLGGTVTAGIVSATGREIGSGPYDNFIQIDAPVNRGNSGGPTFNLKGEVIGINTSIYSPSGGSVGIAFDIPASTAEHVIASLQDHGNVVRAWLGVEIQPITSEIASSLHLDKAQGALVAQPQDNGPALKAGIQAGDAILAVDGKEVKDARDLAMQVADYAPGTTVTLSVWRDGQAKDIQVRLGTLPEPDKQASAEPATEAKPAAADEFGLSLAPSRNQGGVVVSQINPNGKAADSGLQQGDVIVSVGTAKVSAPAEFEKQVAAARASGSKAVLLQVKNGNQTRFVGLSLANA